MNKSKFLFLMTITIIIIFGSLTIVNAENNVSVTYKSYIDPGYGFYKIRDVTTHKAAPYDVNNKTLTIKQGDTVSWINDADTATTLSIVSEQNLWAGAAKLEKTYRFDIPGKYTFYIKEYQTRRQTIIVEPSTVATIYPTSTYTSVPITIPVETQIIKIPDVDIPTVEIPDIEIPTIEIPIKVSPTMIASVIVALLSIIIIYKVGKNK